MFYLDSDKREIKGWIKNENNDLRKEIGNKNDEMKNIYDKFSAKIEKVVEQQQISDAQFQNKVQEQLDALKKDVENLKQDSKSASEIDALKNNVDNLGQEFVGLNNAVQSSSQAVDALKGDLNNLGREFVVLDNSVQSSSEVVAALKNEVDELKRKSSPAPLLEINSLKKEIGILRTEIAALKNLSEENEALKKEILTLRQVVAGISKEVTAQKNSMSTEFVTQKNSVAELEKKIAAAPPIDMGALKNLLEKFKREIEDAVRELVPSNVEIDVLKNSVTELEKKLAAAPSINMNALKNLLDKFKTELKDAVKDFVPSNEFDALKNFITELEKRIAALESEEETPPPPEAIFYLPERKDIFLPNNREEIIDKIRAALAVGDIEKYLIDNPSDSGKKFQKLLANHVKEAKKFVEKLKLKDLEDAELSEAITTKYFKIFQRTIFDNLLVAIKRGLKGSEEYYLGLLAKVNEYLERCGIYTVNTTSSRKAEAEDYENMTPQTLKTDDATKAEIINSIERLPYRINYLDEFGEQKYFQYAGIMNVYKAV